jgi:hypothetical protein
MAPWMEKSDLLLCFALLATGCISNLANAADIAEYLPCLKVHERAVTPPSGKIETERGHRAKRANFKKECPSHEARHVADWVVDSRNNFSLPFVIVDKVDAKVFVFRPDGELRGAARVLLGLTRGDDSAPGIGDRKLSSIRPEERTTPAGRFVASLGHNLQGTEILWVDYDAAISLHRVVTTKPREHRLQRLSSPTTVDKRITYGCINVPVAFFNNVVRPAFAGTDGIVYVLPETTSAREFFGLYDLDR